MCVMRREVGRAREFSSPLPKTDVNKKWGIDPYLLGVLDRQEAICGTDMHVKPAWVFRNEKPTARQRRSSWCFQPTAIGTRSGIIPKAWRRFDVSLHLEKVFLWTTLQVLTEMDLRSLKRNLSPPSIPRSCWILLPSEMPPSLIFSLITSCA